MTRAGGPKPASVVITYVAVAAAVVLAASLVWGLRSLIVPVFVGGLLAYICRPLVVRLERYRIPRNLAIGLLLLMLVGRRPGRREQHSRRHAERDRGAGATRSRDCMRSTVATRR